MKLGSVLKQIIQDKKKLVEESKNKISLEELKNKLSFINETLIASHNSISVSYTHLTLPTIYSV